MITTYHLRHTAMNLLLPYPFATREAAEAHRAYLGAEERYTIYEVVPKVESEEEREAREEQEWLEDVEYRAWLQELNRKYDERNL